MGMGHWSRGISLPQQPYGCTYWWQMDAIFEISASNYLFWDQNLKSDILRCQMSLTSVSRSNIHLSVRMSVTYAWHILLSQRLWAGSYLLGVSSEPSGSPGTAVVRLRLQLEAPKVAYLLCNRPRKPGWPGDAPAGPKCHEEVWVPVSHDVVHWGTLGGGDKTVPYHLVDRLSTAPPPAPHRGLEERKLV